MYSLPGYGSMIADERRMFAYREAIESVVTPGCTVLDIGTGTGIMAILACRAGAGKVWAVEADDVINIAKRTVSANGLSDRITLCQAFTTALELPTKVDVILSDLRGVLPLFGQSVTSIIDARNRLLKPDGKIVAAKDTLWACIASSESQLSRLVRGWEADPHIDFSLAREKSLNTWKKARLLPSEMCTRPRCWGHIDYYTVASPHVSGEMAWDIDEAVTAHGFGAWFDCATVPGIEFSNSPTSSEEHIYGQAFFPWPRATNLSVGDQVRLNIRASLVGTEYTWIWNTDIVTSSGQRKAAYRQSTFDSTVFSGGRLKKRADGFVPQATEASRIDLRVMQSFGQGLTLGAIADALLSEFPGAFRDRSAALERVGDLSERYSA